jgi:hypothetical protein
MVHLELRVNVVPSPTGQVGRAIGPLLFCKFPAINSSAPLDYVAFYPTLAGAMGYSHLLCFVFSPHH